MTSIGSNTNAPAEILSSDCLLIAGEDAASNEELLCGRFGPVRATHRFRGYVFQKRERLTTIFSGMGTACLEPLLWEMKGRISRIILVGTAGLMPKGKAKAETAYIITSARAAGTGMDAIGISGAGRPRWQYPPGLPTASIVSTDFYYGFTAGVCQTSHPLHKSALPAMFSSATEDMVDMEVAALYGLCVRIMPVTTQYIAIKAPANVAGIGDNQLANTPMALELCVAVAQRLLTCNT